MKLIIDEHMCPKQQHAHQCFVPTAEDGVPAEMIGKCLQIPITMQATWAAECVSSFVTISLVNWLTL
jgi:hypothetical protein